MECDAAEEIVRQLKRRVGAGVLGKTRTARIEGPASDNDLDVSIAMISHWLQWAAVAWSSERVKSQKSIARTKLKDGEIDREARCRQAPGASQFVSVATLTMPPSNR